MAQHDAIWVSLLVENPGGVIHRWPEDREDKAEVRSIGALTGKLLLGKTKVTAQMMEILVLEYT